MLVCVLRFVVAIDFTFFLFYYVAKRHRLQSLVSSNLNHSQRLGLFYFAFMTNKSIRRKTKIAANKFNRKVRFVDTLQGADGYYDKDTGEIVIARDSQKKHVFVFGHEFMHSIENSDEYFNLITHLRNNSAFVSKKLAESGGKWETLLQNKITQYENALGQTLTPAEAEAEIFADAIADELFSDYSSIESLATQNRSVFLKLKQWFYEKLVAPQYEARGYSNKNKASRMTYALMLKAEKAAITKKTTDTNGDIKHSIESTLEGKQYVKADRQVIQGNDSSKWGNQVINYINSTIRNGKNVVVYSQDGDALTISRDTAGKAAFRNQITNPDGTKRTMTDDEYAVKLRAETHIDELSKVSLKGKSTIPDSKNHSFAKDGFNYRTAYFLDADGSYYKLTISVGKNGTINTVYNIGKIKEARPPFSGSMAVTDKTATTVTASTNNISDSDENVNGNVQFSANKPEIIAKITNDYGYSEASANTVYKAARTMKQNAGSTADAEELTMAVVSAIENTRKGEFDSGDVERITRLIAQDAQTNKIQLLYTISFFTVYPLLHHMKIIKNLK